MKATSRISAVVITFFVLLSLLISPVNAANERVKKPDPGFKDKALQTEEASRPYYDKDAVVYTYVSDGIYYSVDKATSDVVEIIPANIKYQITATFSEDVLKEMAQKMIIDFLGNKVDFNSLIYTLGKKEGTFFFRWEEAIKKLDGGSPAYIQVGLSNNGDFLNFINTLPYGKDATKTDSQDKTSAYPKIGPFNQIYSNDGSYWSRSGTMSSASGGYCYLYPATWCTPTTYRYKSGSTSGGTVGTWTPSSNTNTKASVFIPSNNATASATYAITLGNSAISYYIVDQNVWYNTWVSITSGASVWGIVKISLANNGPTNKVFAWDEIWVFNP